MKIPLIMPRAHHAACLFATITVLFLASIALPTHADDSNEYQIKTAFLYNLARMTDWPEGEISGQFTLCFIGKDTFGDALDSIKDKKVRDLPLVMRKDINIANLTQCHMVFIESNALSHLPMILQQVRDKAIMTVGDSDGFVEHGGMVNLALREGKVRLEINPKMASCMNLKISARLLALAERLEIAVPGVCE